MTSVIAFCAVFIGLGVLLFRALARNSDERGHVLPAAPHARPTPGRLPA
jgi:hypothetical protein